MIDTSAVFRNMNAAALDAMRSAYSAADAAKTTETGRAMGMTLQVVEDPNAELMDSMEEISMMFEEKKTQEIAKRKIGPDKNISANFMKSLDAWMKTLPDMPGKEFMQNLMRNARALGARGGTPGELLKMLEEGSRDPTTQYAMLDMLEHADGMDEATIALIKQARQSLVAQKGPEIKAGLNLADAINSQATTPEEVRELRDLYRSEVLGFRNPQECFRSLMAQRGPEGIQKSIEFLLQSCGIDIQSANPSKSMTELSRILSDLQCVDVLTTVMEEADKLTGKMESQFGEKCQLNGSGLMDKILDLTERSFVTTNNIEQLMNSTGVKQLLAQLYFMTGMIGMFRKLSTRLFEDEDSRERMIKAAQEHLDGLVEKQSEEDEKMQKEKGK